MLIINKRKLPGGWKVLNEKNPSFKSTLEDDVLWEERKRGN